MKIHSTIKVVHQFEEDLTTFTPSDVFRIPFDSATVCIDNGQGDGPWINLLNSKKSEEFIVQFESPNFDCGSGDDDEARMFLETIANIIRKNLVPVEFVLDRNCMGATAKRVAA